MFNKANIIQNNQNQIGVFGKFCSAGTCFKWSKFIIIEKIIPMFVGGFITFCNYVIQRAYMNKENRNRIVNFDNNNQAAVTK